MNGTPHKPEEGSRMAPACLSGRFWNEEGIRMNTITIEKIGLTKVKATVEADPALWKESIAKSERKLASQLTLKGFRKGEAPIALARRHLDGMKVMNEAIDSLLDPLFREVLQKEELHPAYSPSVSVTKLSDSDLTLVYEMVLVPTCTLGAIERLEAKEEAPSVTDEEVEARVRRHLEENADLVPVACCEASVLHR